MASHNFLFNLSKEKLRDIYETVAEILSKYSDITTCIIKVKEKYSDSKEFATAVYVMGALNTAAMAIVDEDEFERFKKMTATLMMLKLSDGGEGYAI